MPIGASHRAIMAAAGNVGSGFDPATLFASSEAGGWWIPADLSTVFQERTGESATTSSGVGDVVGTVLDKSGNGNHLIAPSDAGRPILRQSGALYYLEFDGSDDGLEGPALGFTAGLSAYGNIVTGFDSQSDTSYMVHADLVGSYYLCVQDGSSSAISNPSTGTWQYRMDGGGVSWSTRDDAHTALDGAAHIVTIRSNQLDIISGFDVGLWSTATFCLGGYWFGSIALDRDFTGSEQADTEQYIANLSGVTL